MRCDELSSTTKHKKLSTARRFAIKSGRAGGRGRVGSCRATLRPQQRPDTVQLVWRTTNGGCGEIPHHPPGPPFLLPSSAPNISSVLVSLSSPPPCHIIPCRDGDGIDLGSSSPPAPVVSSLRVPSRFIPSRVEPRHVPSRAPFHPVPLRSVYAIKSR